ncbi:MAG: hypothetical protein HOP28_07130 [Gemmatimonadales bacterium]|nr:hypothetical protein [Gemmatimonadales bacterium]
MKRHWLSGVLAAAALCLPIRQAGGKLVDCLGGVRKTRWILPLGLAEVSGLALTDDGRLLAHDDERGRVVEFDYKTGNIVKSFRLGPALPRDDFEGIAVVGSRVYLVTSAGLLYAFAEGKGGAVVPYTVTTTHAGDGCEVEGLAADPPRRALLFLCKTPRARGKTGGITLLRWSLERNQWFAPDHITVPIDADAGRRLGLLFRGSDLSRDPVTGRFLAVASINKAVAEFTHDGRLVGIGPLGKHHPQPEGVAVAKDGTVIVTDEGGNGAARVSVYACGR